MMICLMHVKAIKRVLSVLLMLTATAISAQSFNEIIVDTFTIEEYAEWLSVKQKFQTKDYATIPIIASIQATKKLIFVTILLQNNHIKRCTLIAFRYIIYL